MAKVGTNNFIDRELTPEEYTSRGFPAFYVLKNDQNRIIKFIAFDAFGNRSDFVDENQDFQPVPSGSSTNFSINYDGDKTRFRIISEGQTPKNLQKIIFEEETDKAVEFILYNDHFLNVYPIASESEGLSKGFSEMNAPFVILPKSYAKLKYNPETDLIECWRVNSIGFSLPVNGGNGDVLEKDSSVFGAKWVDRFGGLTVSFLSLWTGSKFANSIISQFAGKIGIGTTAPTETLHVAGRVQTNALVLPPNTSTAIENELGNDGQNVYFGSTKKKLSFRFDIITATGNITIDNNHHNKIIEVSANSIITFQSGLRSDFHCAIQVVGNYTATLTEGSSVTFRAPFGKILRSNLKCFVRMYSANNFDLTGDLITS